MQALGAPLVLGFSALFCFRKVGRIHYLEGLEFEVLSHDSHGHVKCHGRTEGRRGGNAVNKQNHPGKAGKGAGKKLGGTCPRFTKTRREHLGSAPAVGLIFLPHLLHQNFFILDLKPQTSNRELQLNAIFQTWLCAQAYEILML